MLAFSIWFVYTNGARCGGLAQLVRAPASHAGGHWFESSSLHQKVPDFARNQELFFVFWAFYAAWFYRILPDPHRDPNRNRSGKDSIAKSHCFFEKM